MHTSAPDLNSHLELNGYSPNNIHMPHIIRNH